MFLRGDLRPRRLSVELGTTNCRERDVVVASMLEPPHHFGVISPDAISITAVRVSRCKATRSGMQLRFSPAIFTRFLLLIVGDGLRVRMRFRVYQGLVTHVGVAPLMPPAGLLFPDPELAKVSVCTKTNLSAAGLNRRRALLFDEM